MTSNNIDLLLSILPEKERSAVSCVIAALESIPSSNHRVSVLKTLLEFEEEARSPPKAGYQGSNLMRV